VVLFVGILSFVGLALVALYVAGEIGGPILYRLPGDYRGWVAIRYDDPGCAPLRIESCYLVIRIRADGRECTSNPVPGGWRYVRYEYIYPDGRRRKLIGALEQVWPIGTTGPEKPMVETIFVGSKEEREQSWSQRLDLVREMKRMGNR
jgi:hypothetical protein